MEVNLYQIRLRLSKEFIVEMYSEVQAWIVHDKS